MPRYGGPAIVVPKGEPIFACPHIYEPEISLDLWRALPDGVVGLPGEVPPEFEGRTFRWLVICQRCANRAKARPLDAASGMLVLHADAYPTRFA